MDRRKALKSMCAAALGSGMRFRALSANADAATFRPTRDSLMAYQAPEWFRDAKFGIWSHWGPQSGIGQGDWYARNMYIQGHAQNLYHVAHYGHPSKVGYKDLCPLWTARDFDPDYLIRLYKAAGARYFVSMGVHHDNFDLWNSRHTRWNAVNVGPKRDIVGLWRQAALRHGLKFGVSEHLWISYKWFGVAHSSDRTGALTGIPYDGAKPANASLYHDAGSAQWSGADYLEKEDGIPDAWKREWFVRIQDLIENYQPDLLYSDGGIQFEELGLAIVSNLYNQSAKRYGSETQAVYTCKSASDCAKGSCVLDFERSLANEIRPAVWQTDTCIGDWHYKQALHDDHGYKSASEVIEILVDVVSQNGNLLLNFPLPSSGLPDSDELAILEKIKSWTDKNGEGIYGTRPWTIYGEGPSTREQKPGGDFNERKRTSFTSQDIRFTTRGDSLYAFVMGVPQGDITVEAVGTLKSTCPGKIANVQLLGYYDRLRWTQEPACLRIRTPQPVEAASCIKVLFA